MASMSNPQVTQGGTTGDLGSKQTGGQMGIGSPISNEAYDVITALHSKLEGLEAYRKYSKDGNADLWKELTDADVKCVERLVSELENMVKSGKFRMKQPGTKS